MKLLILALGLAIGGCVPAPAVLDSVTPRIAVVDVFWAQRRMSLPDIPNDFQRQQTPSGERADAAPPPPEEGPYIAPPAAAAPFNPADHVKKITFHYAVPDQREEAEEGDYIQVSHFASCTAIGNGWFVTAKHAVENLPQDYCIDIDYKPEVISEGPLLHPGFDIAVFRSDAAVASVGMGEPVAGPATLCGYGGLFLARECALDPLKGPVGDKPMPDQKITMDRPGIRHGDSGGGVFQDGKLVGILTSYRSVEWSARYVPITTLEDIAFFDDPQPVPQQEVPVPPTEEQIENSPEAEAWADPEGRVPRSILVTEPSWCAPCLLQEPVLKALRDWDRKGQWKIGPDADSHIQIVDSQSPEAQAYAEKDANGNILIPQWIRLNAKEPPTTRIGVIPTKEGIVDFYEGRL